MNGNAAIVIVVGLILLYVVISDKYSCIVTAFNCLLDDSNAAADANANSKQTSSVPPPQTVALNIPKPYTIAALLGS